jgi:predicted nucleic acid-binding protein
MIDTVYIETSIVSLATARPSTDIVMAAMQQQAREWWFEHGSRFELVTSQLVFDEAAGGDPAAAAERLALLRPLPIVPIDEAVRALAAEIMASGIMPAKAAADAVHVAAAAVAGVQYLLTYNCTHIANAREIPRIYRLLESRGFGQLLICTPTQFLGGDDDQEFRAR